VQAARVSAAHRALQHRCRRQHRSDRRAVDAEVAGTTGGSGGADASGRAGDRRRIAATTLDLSRIATAAVAAIRPQHCRAATDPCDGEADDPSRAGCSFNAI
jgi:hypothetical protein